MRKLFFTVLPLFLAIITFSQPVNDDCSGIINLGIVPTCPTNTTIYDNVDATVSNIGFSNIPACFNGGTVQNDVWFSFMTTTDIVDITISILGSIAGLNGSISNPQLALYRGSCEFDGLSELSCISSANGDASLRLDILGLTPNEIYFIRVNDYSASATPNWGDFTICAEEYIPDINIGEPSMVNACFGTMYDSGGPEGDYTDGEILSTTICPNDIHSCINIDVSFFAMENGADVLNFYEGLNNTGDLIASLSGNINGNSLPIIVSSNCVTVEFTSDGSVTNEGFALTWQCTPLDCGGSTFDNPTLIDNLPFSANNISLCDGAASTVINQCIGGGFTSGPEYIFQYDAPGGFCASIQISNAPAGTGVLVLNGLPELPTTTCVAQSQSGTIAAASFETAGTYYIIIGNSQGCDDFNITISEADCSLAPALVDALCNPLNGCIEEGGVPSVFLFEDGFEDVMMIPGTNAGCWGNVGVEADFVWFTIEAQADGPFGFIVESGDVPSDIDFNVWGPFTNAGVCETPNDIIDFISNNEPIRSSYAPGAQPTGLADINPLTGVIAIDEFDCNGDNDDIVTTIAALQGEVYVVLLNDWGNNIGDGGILIDWGSSSADVIAPLEVIIVGAQDTAVCSGQTVQLSLSSEVNDIVWIDPTGTLSCTDCPNPVATVNETSFYQAIIDAICYIDTINVEVFVYSVDAGPDLEVCLGEQFQLSAGSNYDEATYTWDAPAGITLSCIDCPMPEVTASTAGTYALTATLNTDICTTDDIVVITVLSDPAPEYGIIENTTICEGDDIAIGGTNTAGVVYEWTSTSNFTSSEANPVVSPTETSTYFITASNGFCPSPSVDSVEIEVTTLPIIAVTNDTTVCQGQSITLGLTEVEEDVIYLWTGPGTIEADTFPNTLVTPQMSGTYTLIATRGICEVSASVNINIAVIDVDITIDTVEICLGESTTLNANVLPAGEQAVWMPNDGSLDTNNGNTVIGTPLQSTTYIAFYEVPGCIIYDTAFVRVDSLPDLSIMAAPMEDPYCEGDTVALISTTYEPSSFPDIAHQWLPGGPGYQTPDSFWNMVFIASDTFLYQRISINNACIDTAEIQINVQSPPLMSISPTDTTICEGESVQFILTFTGADPIVWSTEPDDGSLSCTDCFDPLASPTTTTSYSVESDDACSSAANAIINVDKLPNIDLVPDTIICDAETEVMALNLGITEADVTYTWSSPDDETITSSEAFYDALPTMTTTFELSAANDCGTVTQQTTITVIEEPNLTIADLIICLGEAAIIEAITDAPDGTNELFEWSVDNIINQETGPILTLEGLTDETEVSLSYTYGPNCGTITQTAIVSLVGDNFLVSLSADPDTVFIGGSTVLTATITADPPITAEITYTWFQDGAEIGTTTTPTFTVTDILGGDTGGEDIILPYTVTAMSTDGCVRMGDTSILVQITGFTIPNVFTPNNDGLNDEFKVYHTDGVEVNLVQVFNRWGELVFESLEDDSWNGMYKNKPAQSDVYLYRVMFTRDGETKEQSGEITLLR